MYSFTGLGTYGFSTTPINTLQCLQILAPKKYDIYSIAIKRAYNWSQIDSIATSLRKMVDHTEWLSILFEVGLVSTSVV